MHRLLRVLSPIFFACALNASYAGASPTIEFTSEEKAYIAAHPVITMCVDPDWEPFERINEAGQHEGIAADLVQLLASRVGLKVELYPTTTWDASIAASKNQRCQIMSFVNRTPVRDQWLVFTEPIFYDQNVIITREDHPYIGDPKGLKGQRVALPRGTMVEERVRRDYPDLIVVTTSREAEAVTMVSERKADLTIRSLIVAAYAIKKEGLFNLKISGQIPDYVNRLRIGVLKDEPVLRDILDKGVKTITPQERDAIANRHVSIKVERGVDYTLVWGVVLVGGLIMAIVLYWNRKLSALNRELEHLSVTDKLTGLFNRVKIDESLDHEIRRSQRTGQVFSVILADLDHFKRVNDMHGHQAGDKVLIAASGIHTANTRKTDIVGRWGGEEFIVICTNTDRGGAMQLAETLCQRFRDCDFPVVGRITASFGVSTFQPDDETKDIVARADAALYEAKHKGRNRVEAG